MAMVGIARNHGTSTTLHRSARQTRRLRLRGGVLDGLSWSGEIDLGGRVCCGVGPWEADHVYVVTARTIPAADGRVENIAVPADF
jgi:hypothetical protein